MKRVTGIGGIFFKARDPKALGAWYRDHLGLDVTDWGGAIFEWGGPDSAPGMTIWSPFKQDSTYMDPGTASFLNRGVPGAGTAVRRGPRTAVSQTPGPQFGKLRELPHVRRR